MQIAIVQFPGSTCERETMLAVKRAGMTPVPFLWNESPDRLVTMDAYVIVGGFSYADSPRAGIIAALQPMMKIIKEQSELGKPVLGIGNGAQILVEAGLVPGLEDNKVALALTENKRMVNGVVLGTGFYNAWIHMRLTKDYQRNVFTNYLNPADILAVPVAHSQGRFVMSDALFQEVALQGLNVFEYCDAVGAVKEAFPINPNGSMHNIAALSNKAGNVLAMMPHIERTTAGDPLFQSMREYLSDYKRTQVKAAQVIPLYYYPRRKIIPIYATQLGAYTALITLLMPDQHAIIVENTLNQLGYPVKVTRYLHWEIVCDSPEVLRQIKSSGVLFNEHKEKELTIIPDFLAKRAVLVRAKDDVLGWQTLQTLRKTFSMAGVHQIHRSVLWHFTNETISMETILATNIIGNAYAHDYYYVPQSL